MIASRCRRTAISSFLVVLGLSPAGAVEAPLTRASFERALQEGRSCRRIDPMGPYVAARKSTESILASIVDNLIQTYTSDEISNSYMTVRLTTPYTRVRRAACEAKLLGDPIDESSLWETARTSATVSIWVETSTTVTKNDPQSREDQAGSGVPPDTVRKAGPRVVGVALKRGQARDAPSVEPVSGGEGVDYDFPAAALQGDGPFFAVVHTEDPDGHVSLKLKRSVLRKP